MADAAVGDAIASEDPADLMRRINTLEEAADFTGMGNLTDLSGTFSELAAAICWSPVNDNYIHCVASGNVFTVDRDGTEKDSASVVVGGYGCDTDGTDVFTKSLDFGDNIFYNRDEAADLSNSIDTWQPGGGSTKPWAMGASTLFDLSSASNVKEWTKTGTDNGDWSTTGGADIAADGTHVYVLDNTNDLVRKYNESGTQQASWSTTAGGNTPFLNTAIAVEGGVVYTLTTHENTVPTPTRYDEYLTAFDTDGVELLSVKVEDSSTSTNPTFASIGLNVAGEIFLGQVLHRLDGILTGPGQTTFFRYPTETIGDKVSAGTPDGGSAVPADSFFAGNIIRGNEWHDMHEALETIAPFYVNAVTGNPWNFTASSADNILDAAVGHDDWDHDSATAFNGEAISIDDWDEVDGVCTKLEASDTI